MVLSAGVVGGMGKGLGLRSPGLDRLLGCLPLLLAMRFLMLKDTSTAPRLGAVALRPARS